MRPLLALLTAAAAATALSAARADTITQVRPAFSLGGPDESPWPIYGALFNPSLGTLDSVTATLTGSYSADTTTSFNFPPTTPATIYYDLRAFGNTFSGTDGGMTLSFDGHTLRGSASFSPVTFQMSNLSPFEGDDPHDHIADFSVYAWPDSVPKNSGLGDSYDDGSFRGTFTLTYDYTPVPEPGTAPLFAVGIVGLVAMGGSGRVWRRFSRCCPS